MIKKILYNIFVTIGMILFFILPIYNIIFLTNIELRGIKLPAFGALILGVTFLINYYSSKDKKFRLHFWWQNVGGIYLVSVFVVEMQKIFMHKFNIQIILYVLAMIVLILQNKFLRK